MAYYRLVVIVISDKKDIIIIGGGPAGISAALTAVNRGKDVLIISSNSKDSGLCKTKRIDNYPGIPQVSGLRLQELMEDHALKSGASIHSSKVISVVPGGDGFLVSAGSDFFQCSALIFAVGITHKSFYPGESEFLGSGVSYCATCDGMLYRDKKVAVIAHAPDAVQETNFLRSIGCDVTFFAPAGSPQGLDYGIPVVQAKSFKLSGDKRLTTLTADDVDYDMQGVFILRSSIAMTSLLPELELSQGHINVDRSMRTNLPGIFAAGDCTGLPYQIGKAVGEGNIAALSASEWIEAGKKQI